MSETLQSGDPAVAPKPVRASRRAWNFTPSVPLTQAPYFEWPISLAGSLKYLFEIWRPLNQRFLLLMLAIAVWTWFTPSLERAASFQIDWMLEIALRNLVIVLVVAGGLHLLLFTFARQGDEQRYDARPLAKKSKVFHFGSQLRDNVFWTLVGACHASHRTPVSVLGSGDLLHRCKPSHPRHLQRHAAHRGRPDLALRLQYCQTDAVFQPAAR